MNSYYAMAGERNNAVTAAETQGLIYRTCIMTTFLVIRLFEESVLLGYSDHSVQDGSNENEQRDAHCQLLDSGPRSLAGAE